jgi:prevent-host-death family protein
MRISATEFKAKCLALIDQVHSSGEPVVITKRGRVMASLIPEADTEQKPWLRLRGTVKWSGDPFQPVVDESEIEALR